MVEIKDSDLKFEMKTSSGAGGQNVNRNFTCVRCTHLPTGLVTESQESRYQWQNKDIAIRKIKAMLNEQEYERREKEAKSRRKIQIGIASRSDKIRTYNFNQDRITDHRLGSSESLHNIQGYFAGEESGKLQDITTKLEHFRRTDLVQQLRGAIQKDFFSKFKQ